MRLLKSIILAALIVPLTLNFAHADETRLCSQTNHQVSPIRDAIDYMIIDPALSISDFFRDSIDDFVEDGTKIATLYLAYTYLPFAQVSLRYKAAAFPVLYTLANHLGDKLGDMVEANQPKPPCAESKDPLRSFANDIGEDTTKLFCYVMKFAKGIGPSRAAAEFVQRTGMAPGYIISIMHYYGYFSAISKVASDFQSCEKTANAYGDWLEGQVANLRGFVLGAFSGNKTE